MNRVRQLTLAVTACGLLGGAAGWWWAEDARHVKVPVPGASLRPVGDGAGIILSASGLATAPLGTASAAPADAFLVNGLRHRIEQLLLDAGPAATPAELKQKLLAQLAQHFRADELTRAAELVGRYVDYRVAVSSLKPPRDISDPHALREALDTRQRERRKHFTDEEWQALFAQEEELDRFTIARLEIARNAALQPAQKEAALRAAESELGEAQRAWRREAVVHEEVATQTASFEAAATSEQERYAQRRAAYGEEAAQRLAGLDREERDWQGRLDRFAALRGTTQDPAQLEAARQQLFSAQEQQRVDAALALRQMAKR